MSTRHVLFMVTLVAVTLPSNPAEADVVDCDWPFATLVHPEDGTTVEGKPAEIVVKVNVRSGETLRQVGIEVDGNRAASRTITEEGTYDLSIALDPGTHELVAFVEDDCMSGHSDSISITVKPSAEASVAKTDEGPEKAAAAKIDDVPQKADIVKVEAPDAGVAKTEDGSKKGCAVDHTPSSTIAGLSALGLAVLGAWRLRRAGA
jgi:MYXO-CTERM domain-containing protein